ncbi:lysophospholipid acyltransferase family protein [Streptomyces boncukensis]|uniref:lysophospholipid acyltransferase family protein n=1 Tax=Streptomyces boncukensis TaxID=2711219 RepID=UPI0030BA27A7
MPGVPLGAAVRRGAALGYVVARALALGDRLAADPEVLRARAGAALAALGVRFAASPGPGPLRVPGARAGTLVVANHISWLDALVLLAVEPVPLVAKREVAHWPVVGTLARRAGTRFLDRARVRALPHAVARLAEELRAGRSVLVFPQATTWCSAPGGPFRRAVFQAAADAGAPVRPVTLAYEQRGAASTAPAYLGDDDFATSLRRVLCAAGLTARVTAHPPLYGDDRRALAAAARSALSPAPGPGPTPGPGLRRTGGGSCCPATPAGRTCDPLPAP